MGGWTSVALVHPVCVPPAISGGQLAEFVDRFLSVGITSRDYEFRALEVKFGESIDQDDHGLYFEIPDPEIPGLASLGAQDTDIQLRGKGIDLVSPLRRQNEVVYRASIGLGCISDGATDGVHAKLGEGYLPARLFDWSFEIGPLTIESPVTGKELMIGWMSLSLGGQGYMTDKLTPKELVECVRELPECRAAEDLVRSCWPVRARSPSSGVRQIRKDMGQYWLGVSEDVPLDWFWTFVGSN